jgi:hypothetical protein
MDPIYSNILLRADFNTDILSHMDDNTLSNLCKSNHYFNTLCTDPLLWKLKIGYISDIPIIDGLDHTIYKDLYFKVITNNHLGIFKMFYDLHTNHVISQIDYTKIDDWVFSRV